MAVGLCVDGCLEFELAGVPLLPVESALDRFNGGNSLIHIARCLKVSFLDLLGEMYLKLV